MLRRELFSYLDTHWLADPCVRICYHYNCARIVLYCDKVDAKNEENGVLLRRMNPTSNPEYMVCNARDALEKYVGWLVQWMSTRTKQRVMTKSAANAASHEEIPQAHRHVSCPLVNPATKEAVECCREELEALQATCVQVCATFGILLEGTGVQQAMNSLLATASRNRCMLTRPVE
jgi:hypothetical protein